MACTVQTRARCSSGRGSFLPTCSFIKSHILGCRHVQVPEAVCLPGMTYHEAWELSYFGANVLHPRTTLPAMKYHIPITIRNFFNLPAPGELSALTLPRASCPRPAPSAHRHTRG